ncbi:hypothetical protein EDD11_005740 [Mortierella claussenii]|nr:hypothetical protein EDD11_005740 [Mortierella claussenii]
MTAPVGIRVNRVKIPAFPYRSRAEAIVMECLTEEERKLMPSSLRRNNALHHDQDRDQAQARRSMFSVKVQQDSSNHLGLGMEMNSIHGGGARRSSSSSNSSDESRSGYSSDGDRQEDQFAEGLDAEWLEYIGPEDGNDTIGAKDNSSNVAAILYLHGGGYYTGSKEEHRVLIGPLVKRLGRNIRILTVNYRLAPQHPFPAALIDALSCYMWLLEQPVSETFSLANDSNSLGQGLSDTYFQPNQIVFMGDSAGGGLALSLSLLLRDYGRLPQPLTIATWSPWMDLTQSLPSFKNNALTDCIPYENYVHQHSDAVDRIFEDEYDGGESGMDGDDPEEFGVETGRRPKGPRQRAQVYCPDSCLRIKYVSPMFETNFRGIPSVFITCGSAERFVDECVLMAARLEAQQQPCRIDLHEDMPHIFPLFRFHPSATAALDRTSAYIRKVVSDAYSAVDNEGSSMTAVDAGAVVGRIEGDVIIPISPSSSSHSSSAANSPLLSSSSKGWFEDQQQQVNSPSLTMILEQGNSQAVQSRKAAIRRVDSSSSMSSSSSSSSDMSEESLSTVASSSSQLPRSSASASKVHKQALLASSNSSRKQSAVLETDTTGPTTKSRTIVNVVDLSGTSVMSYHKQTRPGSSYNEPDLSLDVEGRRRRHPPSQRKTGLTLEDVVSDATLFEWEILLKQGYIPTRYWPYPPHRKA